MKNVYIGRYKDRTNFTSDEFLHINSCGVSRFCYSGKPRTTQIYRPDGRVDYHFFLVTAGTVTAVCCGKCHTLTEGDGMFYRAHDPQDYNFIVDERSPVSSNLYVHFCGTAIEEAMQKANLVQSMPIRKCSGEIKRVFDALIRSYRLKDDLTACGNLLRLISVLSPNHTAFQNESVRLISAEAEYISSHYAEEIDLDASAARCNLSRSRFTHLFGETFGISPYRFQLRLRLEQACELLSFSSLSVAEIADSLGFSDPLYFSRLFKRVVGVSPSEYRRK